MEVKGFFPAYRKNRRLVVEIFSLIIAGYNASEVARMLNERKIPTRVQNQWKNGINYVQRIKGR